MKSEIWFSMLYILLLIAICQNLKGWLYRAILLM
jgi:hypothetical protein